MPTHKHTQEINHDVRERRSQDGGREGLYGVLTVGLWPGLRSKVQEDLGAEFGEWQRGNQHSLSRFLSCLQSSIVHLGPRSRAANPIV